MILSFCASGKLFQAVSSKQHISMYCIVVSPFRIGFSCLLSCAAVALVGRVDGKVLRFVERADLAFALRAKAPRGINLHESLGPLDRLSLRRELEDRVAGDQLLRFREGPVDHRALASGVPDPRPL